MPAAQRKLIDDEPTGANVVQLADLANGQEADFFALLSAKEQATTRDGKPYFRVTFRDARREVNFPIWSDAPLTIACRDEWKAGIFYKLRAAYRETSYGPQLEIRRIRAVNDADVAEGFDAAMCLPRSRQEPAAIFDELRQLVLDSIGDATLSLVVTALLGENRETLLKLPAATYNHHAYAGGFLEHVLSVARTCVYLADKYCDVCPELNPPLDKDLVVAGGVLHDIGKIRELQLTSTGAEYSPAGALIGHILQGRDMLREAAATHGLMGDKLLRLEHIIVSHQRLAEWGAPKPPMTPEALLVHYADDLDAKLHMMCAALVAHTDAAPLTSAKNPLRQRFYRGDTAAEAGMDPGAGVEDDPARADD